MKKSLLAVSLLLLFFACKKEEIQTNTSLEAGPNELTFNEDCLFNPGDGEEEIFEFCTGEYQVNAKLTLVNEDEHQHYIRAYINCHKQGAHQDLIPIHEFKIDLSGKLSPGCGDPIDITIASDYNNNLVAGQVVSHASCHDCKEFELIISYSKLIGLNQNIFDFIKGSFTAVLEDCGQIHEVPIVLVVD